MAITPQGNNPMLILQIGKRFNIECADIGTASAIYQKLRDKSQEGASTFAFGKLMQAGKQIATISYNGRVWDNDTLIAEATKI
jgi:hypothetical protein